MSNETSIHEITGDNLSMIHDHTAVVVFTADWCSSCHNMMNMLSSNPDVKVPIYNCDVDVNETLADKMQITNLPVIGIVHDGDIVDIMRGMPSVKTIMDSVHSYM